MVLLTLLNAICFWHRNLIFNLAAVAVPGCVDDCSGSDTPFAPICVSCMHFLAGDESTEGYESLLEECEVSVCLCL